MKEILATSFLKREDLFFQELEQRTNREFLIMLSMVCGALALFAGVIRIFS
jgi:hypothetical protein